MFVARKFTSSTGHYILRVTKGEQVEQIAQSDSICNPALSLALASRISGFVWLPVGAEIGFDSVQDARGGPYKVSNVQ